jgi:hypothetical protein
MKIDITNFNTKEIVQVLKAFPLGKVIVDENKAFWDSENKLPEVYEVPQQQYVQQPPQPQQRQPQKQNGDFFKNMKNSLFESFSN